MMVRRAGRGMMLCAAMMMTTLCVAVTSASAAEVMAPHAGHDANGAGMPPVVTGGGGAAPASPGVAPAGQGTTPGVGAQPAAPQNAGVLPTVAGDDGAGEGDGSAAAAPSPTPITTTITTIAEPVTAPVGNPKTVDGGGSSGGGAAGGGDATEAPATEPAPSGELPFTGVADNVLLISLAGMFAPLGVLLYCGARRGDRRLALAMPRFHWAPASRLPAPVPVRRVMPEPAPLRWPEG